MSSPPNPYTYQIGGDHYKDMAIQPSAFIAANNIPWYPANAIKYLCRYAKKGGIQDLEKAIHYTLLAMEEYKNGLDKQAARRSDRARRSADTET